MRPGRHRRQGFAWLALLALAVHFLASFGHHHAHADSRDAVQGAAHGCLHAMECGAPHHPAAEHPAPEHPAPDDGATCSVCWAAAAGGAWLLAVLAVVLFAVAPTEVFGRPSAFAGPRASVDAAFRARGPPSPTLI